MGISETGHSELGQRKDPKGVIETFFLVTEERIRELNLKKIQKEVQNGRSISMERRSKGTRGGAYRWQKDS
jgi:hypothetical protein